MDSEKGRIIKVRNKLLKNFLKLLKIGIFAISVLIISLTLIYFMMPKVIDVREIIKNPDAFKGKVGVVGEVYSINNDSSSFLLLDCEKKIPCITIPVAYKGRIPEVTSEIIVYGKLKSEKMSRFIETFEAYKIYARNDDFKGNIFYSIRKWVREKVREGGLKFRRWLYSNCRICLDIKKRLVPETLIP